MALNKRRKYNSQRTEEAHSSFYGDILKEARERHGIDIAEVADELHVRKDILIALENGDFSQIPPQGYSRNMVKTYSRILGLDANKMTNMFLDSEYSYQVSKKRASAQKISEENKKRTPKTGINKSLTPREHLESVKQDSDQNISNDGQKLNNNRTFHTYENKYRNTPRQRGSFDTDLKSPTGRTYNRNRNSLNNDLLNGEDPDSARQRLASRKKQNSQAVDRNQQNPYKQAKIGFGALKHRHTISGGNSYKLTDEENPNTIRNKNTNNNASGSYTFMNVHKSNNTSSQSKLTIPIIIGSVVLLLIVLIIIFFLVGKQHENDKTDVSKLNVVGISDVENPNKTDNQNSGNNDNAQTEVPKDVEFKYKVKPGVDVYMEIYEGNNSRPTLAREVKSDETNTFKVTDKLKFVTSNPNSVDIFVNNEAVTPQSANNNGVYTYVVDYNEYIQQWKAKHPNAKQ